MAATAGRNATRNCFMCLKHYLRNVISQHVVYLEDKIAGCTLDGFRYVTRGFK